MTRYIRKQDRIRIINDHLVKNEGVAKPSHFVEEASDPSHPAHGWFEWDDMAGEAVLQDSYQT